MHELSPRPGASAAWRAAVALRLSPALVACAVAALALVPRPAVAQTSELVDRSRLRVCADPANLPFSDKSQTGFENKIAELLAADLGVPVQYTWFPQATGFVRNTLRARKCDVVIGISLGFELLQNTNPYYRSAYSLVYRADQGIAPADLADPALPELKLGIVAGTPPANLLARNGLLANTKPYQLVVDTRFDNPGQQMVEDVAAGEIDVGILWGPIAGYHAKRQDVALKVVPLASETVGPKLDYRITMGVRFNEPEWKRQLNRLITEKQKNINSILLDYGVPLLDEKGNQITR